MRNNLKMEGISRDEFSSAGARLKVGETCRAVSPLRLCAMCTANTAPVFARSRYALPTQPGQGAHTPATRTQLYKTLQSRQTTATARSYSSLVRRTEAARTRRKESGYEYNRCYNPRRRKAGASKACCSCHHSTVVISQGWVFLILAVLGRAFVTQ